MSTDYICYHIEVKDQNPIELKDRLLELPGEKMIADANKIICREQLFTAIHRANKARDNNKMLANIWGIEVMLQLTGIHQISKALRQIDINDKTSTLLFITDKEPEDDIREILVEGLPEFSITEELRDLYNLATGDECKQVIAKGVLMTLDHQ